MAALAAAENATEGSMPASRETAVPPDDLQLANALDRCFFVTCQIAGLEGRWDGFGMVQQNICLQPTNAEQGQMGK